MKYKLKVEGSQNLKKEEELYWVGSSGYNVNSGFYMKLEDFRKSEEDEKYKSEIWITFPSDIREKLTKEIMMSVNWKLRLKYLFFPNR